MPRTWWLNPGKFVLLFILPLYFFFVLVVPNVWPEALVLRTANYMNAGFVWLGAGAVAFVGAGALIGSEVDLSPRSSALRTEVREPFLIVLATLSITAYLIWFWPAIRHLSFLMDRDDLNRIAGVTSFTQLAVPVVTAYLFARWRNGQRFSRLMDALFVVVVIMAALRVFMWSERLALIELAVPILVCVLLYRPPRTQKARLFHRLVSRWGPFIGLGLLLVLFGATELFRSWQAYAVRSNQSFSTFVVNRLTTYYFTALNNGAGMLQTGRWPSYQGRWVFGWAYALPFGVGQLLVDFAGLRESPHDVFLYRYGDPEFNNMSGIFPIFHDLGIVLGLAYFLLAGFAFGLAYRAAVKGEVFGALFYPPMLVGCMELMRITYLNGQRCFLILVGALLLSFNFQPRPFRALQARAP